MLFDSIGSIKKDPTPKYFLYRVRQNEVCTVMGHNKSLIGRILKIDQFLNHQIIMKLLALFCLFMLSL